MDILSGKDDGKEGIEERIYWDRRKRRWGRRIRKKSTGKRREEDIWERK